MHYFDSDYFIYKDNQLYCDETPVKEITEEYGSPVYVYSKKFFADKYTEFTDAFNEIPHQIFYASKSNYNLSVIKTFYDLGSGVDVNSEGEMIRALKAGVKPEKIILSGVGKTASEIELALKNNLLMIKAESDQEIYLINEIASKLNVTAPVAIRVNPDVDAETHPYISTALAENKFGINSSHAFELFKEEKKLKNIKYTGIDMHLGSQIIKMSPYIEAVEKLSELFFRVKEEGINLQHFDVGGGIGIQYHNEKTFTLKEIATKIIPILKKLNCHVFFEPGRFLVANGGVLITRVIYTKNNNLKNFIIIDAAMNDLLRPSIYKAYHHIQPVELISDRKDITADIVGPICESGDYFAKDREITESKRNEYLAVMSAGAYGIVMSSNYNGRRRPPEVLVDGNKYKLIRSRETFEHLIYDEIKMLK
ncbi:MAG: diaminopimelate decarboxylase [Ignavibacteriaceae bacterium]